MSNQLSPVFVGGFRRETVTEEDVNQLMGQFGNVTGLRFLGTYAFVYYGDEESQARAIQQIDGMHWKGARLGARIQVSGEKKEPGSMVFVGGLHNNATEAFLRQFFEPYGEILRVIVKDRGFGFIHYAKAEDGEAAVKGLHGISVEGRGNLTVRIQTQENRLQTTKVRDVVDGVMRRKSDFTSSQSGVEVYIGGFGKVGDQQIKAAIGQLCSQYGEIESITTNISSGIVRFKSYEATTKFAEDFKFGAQWGDKDLQVSVQQVANASSYEGKEVQSNPKLKPSKPTRYIGISGFPLEFTSSDINNVISVLFVDRTEKLSTKSAQDGIAVLECSTEAEKESLLQWGSSGIPWGHSVLAVSDYNEEQDFDHSAVLSITRISSTVNRRELRVLFGLYGDIANVSKISRGTANILYTKRESVEAALRAVSGYMLDGVPIELARGYLVANSRRPPAAVMNDHYSPYAGQPTARKNRNKPRAQEVQQTGRTAGQQIPYSNYPSLGKPPIVSV